jgi:hypothetical protein
VSDGWSGTGLYSALNPFQSLDTRPASSRAQYPGDTVQVGPMVINSTVLIAKPLTIIGAVDSEGKPSTTLYGQGERIALLAAQYPIPLRNLRIVNGEE